mgnify:CR=1 FL=1
MDPDSTQTSDGSTQSAGSSVPTGAPRDFGEYVLLGELGRGGMGVVYEARQTRLDRIVALKLILAGSWASPIQIERFRLGARAAASLAHPNIVKIFDAGECYGQPYIAMEFIRGRSLAAVLQRGPPRITRRRSTSPRSRRRRRVLAPTPDRASRSQAGQHPAR